MRAVTGKKSNSRNSVKSVIDSRSAPYASSSATGAPQAVLVVPVALLLAYGALRLSITLFTELRELLFFPVTARIARRVSLETFDHLLALSLRFHLERQTGGVSRDIERGSRSIQSLVHRAPDRKSVV